jgi:hypothetical protein
VRKLYHRLLKDGFDPWLDEEELAPGQLWKDEISKAVRNSDVVIVCLSRGSVTKAGFVQKEIKIALDVADEQPEGSIFIIPLKLEECAVPERLSEWHWVNLYDKQGYTRLVKSLKNRADTINIGALRTQSVAAPIGTELTEQAKVGGFDEGRKRRYTTKVRQLAENLRARISGNSRRLSFMGATVLLVLSAEVGVLYALRNNLHLRMFNRDNSQVTSNTSNQTANGNVQDSINSNIPASNVNNSSNQNSNEVALNINGQEDIDPKSTPTPVPSVPPSFLIRVRVRADNVSNGWIDSGLMLRRGQRLRITASGRALVGGGKYSTPAGLLMNNSAHNLMRDKPWGSLIAVIGDDNDDFIFIGKEAELTAKRDGRLFLGLNDDDLNNNKGAYDVMIEAFAVN